jgi:hypothetical protein
MPVFITLMELSKSSRTRLQRRRVWEKLAKRRRRLSLLISKPLRSLFILQEQLAKGHVKDSIFSKIKQELHYLMGAPQIKMAVLTAIKLHFYKALITKTWKKARVPGKVQWKITPQLRTLKQ